MEELRNKILQIINENSVDEHSRSSYKILTQDEFEYVADEIILILKSSGSNETRAISKNEGKKEVCQHRWNEIYDFTFQCGKCGEIDGTL